PSASIGYPATLRSQVPGRLQDHRHSLHVDTGAEHRPGAGEGHLEGGQVNDVGDGLLAYQALEGLGVGDVTGDEGHLLFELGVDEPPAMRVTWQVGGHDG